MQSYIKSIDTKSFFKKMQELYKIMFTDFIYSSSNFTQSYELEIIFKSKNEKEPLVIIPNLTSINYPLISWLYKSDFSPNFREINLFVESSRVDKKFISKFENKN